MTTATLRMVTPPVSTASLSANSRMVLLDSAGQSTDNMAAAHTVIIGSLSADNHTFSVNSVALRQGTNNFRQVDIPAGTNVAVTTTGGNQTVDTSAAGITGAIQTATTALAVVPATGPAAGPGTPPPGNQRATPGNPLLGGGLGAIIVGLLTWLLTGSPLLGLLGAAAGGVGGAFGSGLIGQGLQWLGDQIGGRAGQVVRDAGGAFQGTGGPQPAPQQQQQAFQRALRPLTEFDTTGADHLPDRRVPEASAIVFYDNNNRPIDRDAPRSGTNHQGPPAGATRAILFKDDHGVYTPVAVTAVAASGNWHNWRTPTDADIPAALREAFQPTGAGEMSGLSIEGASILAAVNQAPNANAAITALTPQLRAVIERSGPGINPSAAAIYASAISNYYRHHENLNKPSAQVSQDIGTLIDRVTMDRVLPPITNAQRDAIATSVASHHDVISDALAARLMNARLGPDVTRDQVREDGFGEWGTDISSIPTRPRTGPAI